MLVTSSLRFAALAFTALAFSLAVTAQARAAEGDPAWLRLTPGTIAIVDLAPWRTATPDAALTRDPTSAAELAEDETAPPSAALIRPAGTLVRVADILTGDVVRVRTLGEPGRHIGFTLLERLQPRVPAGTALVAAGGFAGYAFLYPTLGAGQAHAMNLETGTRLTAYDTQVGGVRGESIDFVRLHVRVRSGSMRGRDGWIAVGYTGLPRWAGFGVTPAERQCRCRILEFR